MNPVPGKCERCGRRVYWLAFAWRDSTQLNYWNHPVPKHKCRR